jgi:uncharacterized protein YjiS (DUF1127 family)
MSQSFVLEPRRRSSDAATVLRATWPWFGAVENWLIRRRGRQDLSLLDDRMLKDVGLSPEEALWEARKPFWRP